MGEGAWEWTTTSLSSMRKHVPSSGLFFTPRRVVLVVANTCCFFNTGWKTWHWFLSVASYFFCVGLLVLDKKQRLWQPAASFGVKKDFTFIVVTFLVSGSWSGTTIPVGIAAPLTRWSRVTAQLVVHTRVPVKVTPESENEKIMIDLYFSLEIASTFLSLYVSSVSISFVKQFNSFLLLLLLFFHWRRLSFVKGKASWNYHMPAATKYLHTIFSQVIRMHIESTHTSHHHSVTIRSLTTGRNTTPKLEKNL